MKKQDLKQRILKFQKQTNKKFSEFLKQLEMRETEELTNQINTQKPLSNERYWYISCDVIYSCCWSGDSTDEWLYLTNNCFPTIEEAEEHKKEIKYTGQFKMYIAEHSEPLDWTNKAQNKWVLSYDFEKEEIIIDQDWPCNKMAKAIYASSKKVLADAILKVGEKNVIRYVLDIKK